MNSQTLKKGLFAILLGVITTPAFSQTNTDSSRISIKNLWIGGGMGASTYSYGSAFIHSQNTLNLRVEYLINNELTVVLGYNYYITVIQLKTCMPSP